MDNYKMKTLVYKTVNYFFVKEICSTGYSNLRLDFVN